MIPSIFVEAGNAPSRTTQMPSETSFQTKKELFSIYLQEAKLRKELETPIDDDKPNPLRTYQRMEHELAERRKFFSFNGLTRCKSLPSIYNPSLHSQRQQSTTAFKMESTMHPPHTFDKGTIVYQTYKFEFARIGQKFARYQRC